jgi:hypothetical protein
MNGRSLTLNLRGITLNYVNHNTRFSVIFNIHSSQHITSLLHARTGNIVHNLATVLESEVHLNRQAVDTAPEPPPFRIPHCFMSPSAD